MKKSLSIILLTFVTAFTAFTQAPVLTGTLKDSESKLPLAGATVKLVAGTDSVIMLSDKEGVFEFKNLAVGTYKLSASFSGYEALSKEIVWENKTIRLGDVLMNKEAKTLQSVTVISTPPPVRQKTDTTEFSANQFKVNPDANVEDLVKKMPGITVGRDGTVTAQGEQVRKVTIDGRDFFGDDASAALRNLPAEIVDKIQVFDRLSDQAQFTGVDDGNSQRAINVVTRAGMRNGQFGRVYAGYGTDNRYQAGGNVSFFKENRRISLVGLSNNINQQNFGSQDLLGLTSSGGGGGFRGGFGGGGGRGGFGGFGGGQGNFLVGQQNGISKTNAFGINYNDKWGAKTDVQGSYFFNNSKNENDGASQSQTLFQGKTQYIDQKSLSVTKNYNHRFNLRLEHRIDSNNSIIISPSFNFQKNNSISEAISRTLSNTDTVNTADNSTQSARDGFNIRNNILYRHSFAKKGRTFSVNFNTTFDKNDGESYVTSHYRFYNPFGYTDSLQDQYLLNPTNGYNLSANLNYTEPVGKNGQFQFNYSPSYSKNKANQQTFTYDMVGEKYSKFDTTLSNKFDNITKTQNGGITYRYSPNRDDQFSVGVNLQHSRLESERVFPTTTQVNQTFTNLLPNFQYRKKISANSNIRVFYRARTNFPSVTQLQDVVNQSNPLRVSSGNPELKQSNLHFMVARYIFTNTKKGQSFFANLFFQTASNYISNATYIPAADSVIQQGIVLKANSQFTKPVNLDGYRSLRSFLTYGMPLKFIKSTINLNAGFNYSKLPGLANNVNTVTHNYVYNGGIVVASNISEYIDFNVSYSANFNNAKSSVQTEVNKFINQSAGLQLNLLSKKGWFLQNDVSYQKYTGDGINQDYTLWNAGVGKKFLKNHGAELKLSVFDLLKQNQSVFRTVAENYIEDSQSKVLQQYFMLTFTYNLKNFGKMPARQMNNNRGNDFRRF